MSKDTQNSDAAAQPKDEASSLPNHAPKKLPDERRRSREHRRTIFSKALAEVALKQQKAQLGHGFSKAFAEAVAQHKSRNAAFSSIRNSIINNEAQQSPFISKILHNLASSGQGIHSGTVDSEIARLRSQIAEKEAIFAEQEILLTKKWQKALDEKSETESELKKRMEALFKDFDRQQEALAELQKEKDLGYLLDRICPQGAMKLRSDPSFRRRFEETKTCSGFVLAIDIRRSTDLMLRGKTPELYASFLNAVCTQLVSAIKDHFGVVDKFTGDGLLAYFPDFFTGQDSGYRALAAARACHVVFSQHYREARRAFTVTLKDVGLGIGIDFGQVHLLRITGELTVVGAPVVYACRLSGAPSGHTYMNHSAVLELEARCPKTFEATEVEFDVKHEGQIICQDVNLLNVRYEPALPDWLTTAPAQPEAAATNPPAENSAPKNTV